MRDQFQNDLSAETIASQRHALIKANSKEEIRRCEAHGALAYWKVWHELPVMYPQSELQRVPEHWRTFGSRLSPLTKSPRLAVNPPNAISNYLYAILESEARLSISELGLDPGIGVLHNDTRTRDSLACDLMEPIRPQVDAFLLDWLRHMPLQGKWFFEERNGNCRLTGEFAATLSETLRLWRQALAPFAEGIARTFWSTSFRSSRTEPPATRLTQDRRRGAKGISTQVLGGLSFPSRVSTFLSLHSTKPARLDRFDPIAQLKRAKSLRRQAATKKCWNSERKPDWLNRGFYKEQIQPCLLEITVSKIQDEACRVVHIAGLTSTGGKHAPLLTCGNPCRRLAP